MKYRIKITTFVNGTKIYTPHVKKGFMCWKYVGLYGGEFKYVSRDCTTREQALELIDNHYNLMSSKTIKFIKIEYITK